MTEMSDNQLENYLDRCRARVEAALNEYLPLESIQPTRLHAAMRYAALGNGKRVRPVLVYAAGEALSASEDALDAPACAVELIHTYSLVHDDLPAMDNDDLRRGRKTCHREFDEATAILAGDALQTLAFELLTDPAIGDEAARLRLIKAFAHAVGAAGMVYGQMMDIAAEEAATPLDLAGISRMQAAKTGALIAFAATSGALIAGAETEALRIYAAKLGLAFQIHDDILDVTGDQETTGKRVGKDAEAGKATFVSLLGLEGARARETELIDKATAALSPYGEAADNLRDLARFVIDRQS